MPELPEVETIVRGLRPAVLGRRIAAVEVRERRLRTPVPPDLERQLCSRRIVDMTRHGKHILVFLDDATVWLLHLGMTGRLTLRSRNGSGHPHDRLIVEIEGGGILAYNDIRRFGSVTVVAVAVLDGALAPGVDALSAAFTGDHLWQRARARRTSVKVLLMDQRVVAGLGNIYANEILFHAGVRPHRLARRLSRRACGLVVEATRSVLAAAIASGGSTISDYRDGFDRFGWYQEQHAVYARGGLPCRACGARIRVTTLAGRSTFWCPGCQR
jgi:formamidopyrimidine-DNA glycosylase